MTGVQTCALPISPLGVVPLPPENVGSLPVAGGVPPLPPPLVVVLVLAPAVVTGEAGVLGPVVAACVVTGGLGTGTGSDVLVTAPGTAGGSPMRVNGAL